MPRRNASKTPVHPIRRNQSPKILGEEEPSRSRRKPPLTIELPKGQKPTALFIGRWALPKSIHRDLGSMIEDITDKDGISISFGPRQALRLVYPDELGRVANFDDDRDYLREHAGVKRAIQDAQSVELPEAIPVGLEIGLDKKQVLGRLKSPDALRALADQRAALLGSFGLSKLVDPNEHLRSRSFPIGNLNLPATELLMAQIDDLNKTPPVVTLGNITVI